VGVPGGGLGFFGLELEPPQWTLLAGDEMVRPGAATEPTTVQVGVLAAVDPSTFPDGIAEHFPRPVHKDIVAKNLEDIV
jgi:hypothetical protein